MAELMKVQVNEDSLRSESQGVETGIKGSKRGEAVALDFYTACALEGRVFQVRAGTITTPLVGDVAITDTAAEMTADAQTGYTIIPVYLNIAIRLASGTLHEYAVKSVGAISTGGTAFVPLPLKMGGRAAATTARVQAAGACTVTAELATTTRRHWAYGGPTAASATEFAFTLLEWSPRTPPVLVGPACCYVQVAATTTGPSYYANLDYIELPTVNV